MSIPWDKTPIDAPAPAPLTDDEPVVRYYTFVFGTSTGEYSGYWSTWAENDQDALYLFLNGHVHNEIFVVFETDTPPNDVL